MARVLTHLADLALADGDSATARELAGQSLAIRQDLGDMPGPGRRDGEARGLDGAPTTPRRPPG